MEDVVGHNGRVIAMASAKAEQPGIDFVDVNARLDALARQRNDAQNEVVILSGLLAQAQRDNRALSARLAQMEKPQAEAACG
jgi:hypothetical protein